MWSLHSGAKECVMYAFTLNRCLLLKENLSVRVILEILHANPSPADTGTHFNPERKTFKIPLTSSPTIVPI